jgi:hypothetical protein
VQPQPEEVSPEELPDAAEEVPLPVRAAKVENWIVERWPPHLGHSGLPFFVVTMRSKRTLHSSQTYS